MALLSKETEIDLTGSILEAVNRFLKNKEALPPKKLGIINRDELEKELNIKYSTIRKWEEYGLRCYTPPMEDNRKFFYKVDDVLIFLGMEI